MKQVVLMNESIITGNAAKLLTFYCSTDSLSLTKRSAHAVLLAEKYQLGSRTSGIQGIG